MFDTLKQGMDFIGDIIMPVEPSKPLAMAFVNTQPEPDAMPIDKAYNSGTLFYSLNMPFLAGDVKNG